MVARRLKEDYVNENTLEKKTVEWLNVIAPYLGKHRLANFKYEPKRSALLIIDMQEYFLDEKSHAHLPAASAVVGNVGEILVAYRKLGLPVFFTYYAHAPTENLGIMGRWWNDTVKNGTPESRICHRLKPLETETVLRKTKYSAFAGTDLDQRLKRLDVRQVLITGVMTHLCCETTARAAFQHEYEVYFCIDGTATQTEELHIGSLRALADGFAMPVTTKEVLNCLNRGK